MANVKIGGKIMAAMGVLLMIIIGLGVFSTTRLGDVNDRSTEIAENWLPSVAAVGAMRTEAMRHRTREAGHILSTTPEAIAEYEKLITDALERVTASQQEYEKMISSDEERALYQAYLAQREKYLSLSEEMLALSRVNKNEEAAAIYSTASRQQFFAMDEPLGKLVELNHVGGDTASQEASDTFQQSRMLVIGAMVAAAIFSVVIAIALTRGIAGPVKALSATMLHLAGGDKTVEIPGTNRGDELGGMAKAVQTFKDNMIEADRLRAAQEAEQQRQLDRAKRMNEAVTSFDQAIGEVVNAVGSAATELEGTARSMQQTAEQTSQQSSTVAAAAEQMTQNVQTVASATEELSASIHEISGQVTESTRIVGEAVGQAQDTNAKVKSLAEAAQRIGDVVDLINNIAGQTNLLALNATIEAARAGEAGKGFAVVASEVKTLATQTARATDEIGTQIRAIQEATGSSAEAIAGITQTIGRVNEISTTIASAVEEQGAATQEISRNVQQAAQGTTEVTTNIVQVTQASQMTSSAAGQVLAAAGELSRSGERLRGEVETFLHTVRNL
ncbi:methyl-accepting chemotaxis protein [Dongia sp.]|uniref:methyl-accepting chemotaxis protein n=1 Tax=Dongia sp. TaxID=1977262 RepID=UPI0035B0D449